MKIVKVFGISDAEVGTSGFVKFIPIGLCYDKQNLTQRIASP